MKTIYYNVFTTKKQFKKRYSNKLGATDSDFVQYGRNV